ncbi:MAG: adenine phosphoribosyltransferase [Spirochaetales bacterium]|nr:adenine phosphoribosyltransferase [Spirochaetales bacterium]
MDRNYNFDAAIRRVPDFPKKGVLFYDLTSVLCNPEAFSYSLDRMNELFGAAGFDAVAAVEARGFLFAAPFAREAGLPLVLVRKKGKLPGKTAGKKFALEYGEDEIEIHVDDIRDGWRILLVDDLIATGGTIKAAAELLLEAGAGLVEIFAVVGLPFLNYKKVLKDYRVTTLIEYSNE